MIHLWIFPIFMLFVMGFYKAFWFFFVNRQTFRQVRQVQNLLRIIFLSLEWCHPPAFIPVVKEVSQNCSICGFEEQQCVLKCNRRNYESSSVSYLHSHAGKMTPRSNRSCNDTSVRNCIFLSSLRGCMWACLYLNLICCTFFCLLS